ncbi:MAG TPA: malonyl-CoA decarboxylase [Casimicrobiaceae bacterium]|nr:malonyl-CoA decarboxylase [Casimicrobiaceae bacterium]
MTPIGEMGDALLDRQPVAVKDPRKTPSLLHRLLGSKDGTRAAPVKRAAMSNARRAIALCHGLLSERGEVSGARLAREALAAYRSLDARAVDAFFDLLVEEFSPDPRELWRSAESYRDEPSQANLILLQHAAEPPRQELFRRLNMAPGGTRLIVDMHRDLLAGIADHPQWLGIDADFVHLLRSWFNRGFLSLQRIDWRTSAAILEKLIDYEAVHAIQGWRDLRRRLEADRRCYAFFHPALPDEPLIFIEVALTRGISATVQPLIDPDSPVSDPSAADCAMFYSITNCQQGLRGVSFGNFLIKQVVEDLGRELPRIRRFATISPIPGFRAWLGGKAETLSQAAEGSKLVAMFPALDGERWFEDAALSAELQRDLVPLCAQYLLNSDGTRDPPDSVSRFHLVNGARLERVNWLADTSALGLRQSAGMMVNYVYRLGEVERNHEAYARDRTIVASRRLHLLAKRSLIAQAASAAAGSDPNPSGQAVSTEPVPSQ